MIDFWKNQIISKEIKNYDINELRSLCYELRLKIIDAVLNCGGHLASSLGAVELIVALHYVFDLPKDKLIFDVGHQAYAHKLLTGRDKKFVNDLRKIDGINAFTKREESEYDTFSSGHAGVAISLALGLARARDIQNENYEVISVIGDGSIVNGISFEAMNDCGSRPSKNIVILNDNDMSISKAVGAVSSKLTALRQNAYYKKIKRAVVKTAFEDSTKGRYRMLRHIKNGVKYMFTTGVLFEEFGYKYVGPVDGHNLEDLIKTLESLKEENQPVLLHVVTKKGKGCVEAEKSPEKFHGISSMYSTKSKNLSYSDVFGAKISQLSAQNEKLVAVTAAMPIGTGLKDFSNRYPERFFDVGIAEEHAISLASGLARGGMKPYVAIYSTFLQRAIDQVIHDIVLQNLPVTICVDRAGFVGEDGETHQGIFDLAFLNSIPKLTILSPASKKEFENMLDWSVTYDKPLVIRYPRGYEDNESVQEFEFSSWKTLREGSGDIAIIASGAPMLKESLLCADHLKKSNVTVDVVNASTLKPLDFKYLNENRHKTLFVVEDNVTHAGLYGAIVEYYSENGEKTSVYPISVKDNFVCQGKISELHERYGINASNIADKIGKFVNNLKK